MRSLPAPFARPMPGAHAATVRPALREPMRGGEPLRTRLRRTRRRTVESSAKMLSRLSLSSDPGGDAAEDALRAHVRRLRASADSEPPAWVSGAGELLLRSALEGGNFDARKPGFGQAGGHSDTFAVRGALLEKRVRPREASFYAAAAAGAWPRRFLPRFAGFSPDGGVLLENLTHGMGAPCVVDLKMGFASVERAEPSLRKRVRHGLLDRVTGSAAAGVRLEGIRVARALDGRCWRGARLQAHSAGLGASLRDVLAFFLSDAGEVRRDVALRLRARVELLLRHFRRQTGFRFIGSSVLLVYDNDNTRPHMRWARALRRLHTIADIAPIRPETLSGLTRRTPVDVRMIDFAHSGPNPNAPEIDKGYVAGLETVLAALTAISDRREGGAMMPTAASAPALFGGREEDSGNPKLELNSRLVTPVLPVL